MDFAADLDLDLEGPEQAALAQFIRRCKHAAGQAKYDNSKLPAGSCCYVYCNHCGIFIEQLPEDYLFTPRNTCSQCSGLMRQMGPELMEYGKQWAKANIDGWWMRMLSTGEGFAQDAADLTSDEIRMQLAEKFKKVVANL